MKFNLKEKFQQAKDAGAAALQIAAFSVDVATVHARVKIAELQDATARKTGEIRTAVGEKVDATKEVIKEKTDAAKENAVTNLGKLGDKIGDAATQFGKSARNRLNLRKEEPVVAPVVQEAVKKAQKKTNKKKGAAQKKRAR